MALHKTPEKKQFPQKEVTTEDLMSTMKNAKCVFTAEEVNMAYDKLAQVLNSQYVGLNPIMMVVMRGGMVTAAQLMQRIAFLHRIDYVHATRYKNNQPTKTFRWLSQPMLDLTDQHVLLIDDIFDEGITLKAISQQIMLKKPASLKSCVLLNKQHNRKVSNYDVDFVGLEVDDLFVFGSGMDYHGYLRHMQGIFAKV